MANEKRPDLISRSTLIAEYDRVHIGPPGGARKLMEDAPTVDAVEVVHGRWQWYEALVNPYALCSNCGCGIDKRDALNFDYCPYCGAKMDGDGNG